MVMLENIWQQIQAMSIFYKLLIGLGVDALVTGGLFVVLFYILRPIFLNFESDLAIVSLSVSTTPSIIVSSFVGLRIILGNLFSAEVNTRFGYILIPILTLTICYWASQIFSQVFIYYLKKYTKKTEVMWDDVLLPILSAVVPVLIFLIGGVVIIGAFGFDLSGVWVALGGVSFVLGFALQDILSNFFSGIVLLIDTPFRFGDVLLLEDGSIGMLRQIGIRVTHLYIFAQHCDIFIPNSVLQGQKLTNMSRPTPLYHHSMEVHIPSGCNLEESKKMMQEIILAHPDTLGNIDAKLAVIDNYYNTEGTEEIVIEQQEVGKLRLLAEQEVHYKLEEIEQSLEALTVTVQFAEKGGTSQEEVENIKQEYQGILELIGFEIIESDDDSPAVVNFEEYNEEGLIELIRNWYRIWIRDPNLLDEDQYFISEDWERKINLLKRRSQRLYQKISNPKAEETRLDDYVMDMTQWLKDKLKVPKKKWQEPNIRMIGINHDETSVYLELHLSFFVDDIRLEDGKRGDRVMSQIYQEIFSQLKNTYLSWHGIEQREAEETNGNGVNGNVAQNPLSFVQTGLDPTTAKQGFAFYLSVGKNKSALKSAKTVEK